MCIRYCAYKVQMESRYSTRVVRFAIGDRDALHGPTIIIKHNYDCKMRYMYLKCNTYVDF